MEDPKNALLGAGGDLFVVEELESLDGEQAMQIHASD